MSEGKERVMSGFSLRFASAVVVAALSLATPALALRCGSDLVHKGDHVIEVLNKCGEPVWRERWEDEIIERRFFDTLERQTVVMEEWLYDFGPTRLLHILRFRNSRLESIATGDRGSRLSIQSCREGKVLSIGDTKFEVLSMCGPPDFSEIRDADELIINRFDRSRRTTIRIDEWTYNFGPSYFLLHLIFENGRLKRMNTGGYGF
jgi:hypothetical protein